jgi:hypothetical protein
VDVEGAKLVAPAPAPRDLEPEPAGAR